LQAEHPLREGFFYRSLGTVENFSFRNFCRKLIRKDKRVTHSWGEEPGVSPQKTVYFCSISLQISALVINRVMFHPIWFWNLPAYEKNAPARIVDLISVDV
jgi:hypothetical protein